MSHHTLTALPSGQKELVLEPIGGKKERFIYWGLVGVLWLGGGVLLPSNIGFGVLAIAVVSTFALVRTTSRTEKWLLEPGAATRIVSGWGNSREKYVPMRVLVQAEEESGDYRKVYRLQLEHTAGKVQIGTHPFDRDDRALELARAFAEATGVQVST